MPRYNEEDKKYYLNENYRRWKEPPEEFKYFMERIMPAIRATNNEFKKLKGVKPLSDHFTVSDEAFGLVMLLNELKIWEDKATEPKGDNKYYRKLFVDGHSGNRQGWSNKGLNTYNRLCFEIEERRCEGISIDMEQTMLDNYRQTSSTNDGGVGSGSEEELETAYNGEIGRGKKGVAKNDRKKNLVDANQNIRIIEIHDWFAISSK